MLPDWPAGTVTILVTLGETPHAIPISAAVRAGPERLLLGLADRRGSLTRLREDPRVAVVLLATDLAVTVRGRARVMDEPAGDGVSAIEVIAEALDDHLRPTFALESGVRWHWTDVEAERRDAGVRNGLARLAGLD